MSASNPRMDGIWVAVLIAALVGVIVGPELSRLGSHFLGIEYVDHYGTQWFYWFTGQAIQTGTSLDHTDLFFHPWGKDIFGHTGTNVLDAIVAWPFLAVFGQVLGYNLFVLTGLGLSGLAMARLLGHFVDDRPTIALAAATFALSPFVLFELSEGRPTQAILGLMVLFFERLWVTGRRPGLGPPVAAGVLLALLGYQYWFYAFFAGLAGVAHGIVRMGLQPWSAPSRSVLGRHILMAVVALGMVAPVALPLAVSTLDAGTVPGLLDTDHWTLAMAAPRTVEGTSVGMLEWQPLRLAHGVQVLNPNGTEVFLKSGQWTPLVLIPLLALALRHPQRWPILAMSAVVTAIAMGPIILVGTHALPNGVYLVLGWSLTFFRRLWWPGRAYAVLAVWMAVGTGVGLAMLRARFGTGVWRGAALVLVGGWGAHLAGESLAPMPAWDASIPAGYQCLAEGPEGAVLELPFAWNQAHLYYQTRHGRPIMGGMLENNKVFSPEPYVQFRSDNRFVATLIELTRMDALDGRAWTAEEQQAVHNLGYRYVLYQRDALAVIDAQSSLSGSARRGRRRRVESRLSELLGPPVYTDARVLIYAPWGGPSPCADGSVVPDRTPLGRQDTDSAERVYTDIEQQRFERVFGDGVAVDEP